jgi:Tol biopolymer transport system component
MDQPSLGTSASENPREDRLDSWKEIGAYLKRDVTTVQRWEKREAMPVHRHLHDRAGSVYASRAELDAWMRSRNRAWSDTGNGVAAAAAAEPVADAPMAAESVGAAPMAAESVDAEPLAAEFITGHSVASGPPPAVIIKAGPHWQWRIPGLVAALAALLLGAFLWLQRSERFWKSPIADARFQAITDFDGIAESAAISRDGHLVAFLSDRDGQMDIWVTQVGSGEYHNLTHGGIEGLVNPSIRALSFSPDAALVTFWLRRKNGSTAADTDTWAVPTLGGEPRPYLDGVAEFEWSRDGSQLAYHTSAPGDPLYIANAGRLAESRLIFKASPGLHSHFPLWSRDSSSIYLVHGSVPDKLDIWRVAASGGDPERITTHNSSLMYPVLLDDRTLLYLATDADGSGPWLYSLDTERRVPHRLTTGPAHYTSLASSADGRRLAVTIASPKRTLWRLDTANSITAQPTQIPISTGTGFFPRQGPGYLLYLSTAGTGESIWKFANGVSTQLWHAPEAHILSAPAISPDGRLIAFSVRQRGHSLLNIMQADGAGVHLVSDALDLEGAPAWTPDGRSITTAANDHGTPHLFQAPVDGRSPVVLVAGYSRDPAWSPDGRFVLYSGPDIGTRFAVKSLAAQPSSLLPALTLTRGARHLAFLEGGRTVVFLQGDMQHRNLWQMDLQTGSERPLTQLPAGFDIDNFDLSPDGSEIVLERVQERSDVVLLDLP